MQPDHNRMNLIDIQQLTKHREQKLPGCFCRVQRRMQLQQRVRLQCWGERRERQHILGQRQGQQQPNRGPQGRERAQDGHRAQRRFPKNMKHMILYDNKAYKTLLLFFCEFL